jgi:acetoin utilization protein AcuB
MATARRATARGGVGGRKPMRVKDRMTRPAVTVRVETLVSDAVALMRTRGVRHLPVVDRSRRPVGMVTDRDLRQIIFDPAMQERLAGTREALDGLTVGEVMTWGAVTVGRDTDIRDAARLMYARKIGALPVVGVAAVVGILTETDVLRAFVDVLGEGAVERPYRWAFGGA